MWEIILLFGARKPTCGKPIAEMDKPPCQFHTLNGFAHSESFFTKPPDKGAQGTILPDWKRAFCY